MTIIKRLFCYCCMTLAIAQAAEAQSLRHSVGQDAWVSAAAAAPDRKDPALAGVLSFVIPGVGSMYAGNTTHGIIHLGVHVASYAVIVAGATSCTYDLYGNCDSGLGMAAGGYLALLANDVWSIFTAVHDARAHNGVASGNPGRVVGNLYVDPAVRALGIELKGMDRPVGLQLLSLHF